MHNYCSCKLTGRHFVSLVAITPLLIPVIFLSTEVNLVQVQGNTQLQGNYFSVMLRRFMIKKKEYKHWSKVIVVMVCFAVFLSVSQSVLIQNASENIVVS